VKANLEKVVSDVDARSVPGLSRQPPPEDQQNEPASKDHEGYRLGESQDSREPVTTVVCPEELGDKSVGRIPKHARQKDLTIELPTPEKPGQN
jgi:hypothetical protein